MHTTGLIIPVGDATLEGVVKGPVGLRKHLATSEWVEQVFVHHAFRYWLGRNESPCDTAGLQASPRAYRNRNESMSALITALLTSESFLYRVPASEETALTSKRQLP